MSILNSIKKNIGIDSDYTIFDDQIIMAINTAFFTLWQLGVGNTTTVPFMITGQTEEWTDFIDDAQAEVCKSYVTLRVRLLFDPPNNSFLVDAINAQIEEFECRMTYRVDELNNYYKN